ncbi:RNI-like protein [Basidiobolus meristosporus CBS 931.73]|uniref:RNI-like protein n=1 Tax=Basidiobolus meristosporus CBS 931.73 TaxID=1314790 RepID=A0A1Y1YW02_9FUNG|nr:RNI-like protein [Basidiobolus meristosporus CBS 931.73]|eukprot:ORY02014.1 RNI-like protein [Basidiobolus meristosporus CBS 931.73]
MNPCIIYSRDLDAASSQPQIHSPSTCFISRVPHEIIEYMLSFLREDLADLWSCCLVNRQWNHLASSELWRTPVFSSQKAIRAFKETVTTNVKVANLVKEFAFDEYRYQIRPIARVEELIHCLPNLTSIRLPPVIPLFRPNSLLSFVSHSLPNIKSLGYRDKRMDPNEIVDDLVRVLDGCHSIEHLTLDFEEIKPFRESTLQKLQTLPPISSLTSLDVWSYSVKESFFSALFPLTPNLRKISFTTTRIPLDIVHQLVRNCPRLTSLRVKFLYSEDMDHKSIQKLCTDLIHGFRGQLKELGLSFFKDPNIPQDILNSLWDSSMCEWEILSLSNFVIPTNSMIRLSESVSGKLKVLDMCNIMGSIPQDLKAWDSLLGRCGSSLTSLFIGGNSNLDDSIGLLIAEHCTKLEKLSLRNTLVTDRTVVAIAKKCGPSLRYLDLSGTSTGAETIDAICQYCCCIKDLILQRPLSRLDECMDGDVLIPLIQNHGHRLKRLNIYSWRITDEVLNTFSVYGKGIRELTFMNNRYLSDENLRGMLDQCRKLRKLYIFPPFCPKDSTSFSLELLEEIQERCIDYI